MSRKVAELVVRLTDRVQGPARAVARSLKGIKTAMVNVNGMTGGERIAAYAARNAAALQRQRMRMLDAAAGAYVLQRAIGGPIRAAMAFEDAMADVNKVVDFKTPDGLGRLSSEILGMSQRLPMAGKDIAAIVAAAGQAGMAGGELTQFAELATKVGIAFDMTADQTGTALAKIKTALGLTVTETSALADAINHLSNTSASSAPDLIEFMRRVGSTGKQYGFSAEQTAAIGSAMVAAGAEASVAATSFRNVGRALVKGDQATKAQRKAFAALGLDAKKVAAAMQRDAVGTLTDVVGRLRSLPAEVRAARISQLFGDEARAVAPLIENSELLKSALGSVAEKARFLGSAQREYEARAKTTSNALRLFRNRAEALGIAIGSALLPALNSVLSVLGPIVTAIADFASANPTLTAGLVGVTAGLIGLRIASIGLGYGLLAAKGALLSISAGVVRLIPILGTLRTAFMFTGVGAVLTAIAAAGMWIYNNWSGLTDMFAGFSAGFTAAIGPLPAILSPVIGLFSSIGSTVSGLLGPLDASAAQWTSWGIAAGSAAAAAVNAIVGLPESISSVFDKVTAAMQAAVTLMYDAGVAIGQALWDGLKSLFDRIVAWVTAKAAAILAPIASIAGRVRNAFSAAGSALGIGGGGGNPSGARAKGGPVSRGGTYWVGERGPEPFTPTRSGFIHPSSAAASPAPAGAVVNFQPVFNFQGRGDSDDQLVGRIRDVLRDEVRETFRGVYADTGMRFA